MKNKKHYVYNGERLFWMGGCFLGMLLCGALASVADYEEDGAAFFIGMWVVTAILACGVIGCFLFMRHHYVFDAEGIRVVWFFGKYQYIKWVNIRSVEVFYDMSHGKGGAALDLWKIIFFVYRKYKIIGRLEDNFKNYREFVISKSLRTTKYINRYWNGIVKSGRKGKKTKRNSAVKLDTRTVRKAEKEAMAKADTIFGSYRDRFAQHRVEIRKSYIYNYEDGSGRSKVRPADDYTFDIEVTIHENHRDHSKNLSFSIPIAEGAPGKTEYVGGESEDFERELREELDHYLREIAGCGFTAVYEREQEHAKRTVNIAVKEVLLMVLAGIVVAVLIIAFACLFA